MLNIVDPLKTEAGRNQPLGLEDRINPVYLLGTPLSVHSFGVKGDGRADELDRLQAAIEAAVEIGRPLHMGDGLTLALSGTLELPTGLILTGSSTVVPKSAMAGALLDASGSSGVVVNGITIDSNELSDHGIQLSGGDDNAIIGCTIKDTLQAGVRAENGTRLRVSRNRILECGRNAYTDNHGIMLYSTSGELADALIDFNVIRAAYRKGIGTYSAGSGQINGIRIIGNLVRDCGLGGIYVAGAGAGNQSGVVVVANECRDNYAGIFFDHCDGPLAVGNTVTGCVAQPISHSNCSGEYIDHNALHGNASDPTCAFSSRDGLNTGLNIAAPLNTLHVNGGLTLVDKPVTLANGDNHDVVIPDQGGQLYVVGPTAAYAITGLAGGHAGRRVTIFNYTNHASTIKHATGSATANQILLAGGSDIIIPSFGAVELSYFGGAAKWTAVGVQK